MLVDDVIKTLLEEIKTVLGTETVIGKEIRIADKVVVPVVRIAFGFGAGGAQGEAPGQKKASGNAGGGGGGVLISPVGFLYVAEDKVQMLPVHGKKGIMEGLMENLPVLAEKLKDLKKKRGEKESEAETEASAKK
jgi:uncharacterized spore protein YtfJ